MIPSDDRLSRLVNIAREAQRYFRNVAAGNGHNGPHDAILIGRGLSNVLELFEDVEPMDDADRRAWQARRAGTLVESR